MTRAPVALLLTGCASVGRFVAPDAYVMAADPDVVPGEVRYTSGFRDDVEQDVVPEPFRDGLVRPVPIASDGVVVVRPEGEGEVEVWLRRPGLDDRGFTPVFDRTGALPATIPLELRLGWEPAGDGRVEVPLDDLANVYSGTRLRDGDLLLVRVVDPDQPTRDHLFRVRRFGLTTRFGAGLLVRVPVPGVDGQRANEVNPSSTLAISMSLGYLPRTRDPVAYWLTEQLAVAFSVGVGSTAVDALRAGVVDPVDDQVAHAFDAAIVGGGLEALRFVSLQAQVNLSSFLRDGAETPWALAVGFDAVRFAAFSRDAVARLAGRNELSSTEPRPD